MTIDPHVVGYRLRVRTHAMTVNEPVRSRSSTVTTSFPSKFSALPFFPAAHVPPDTVPV
jgi:hypothetical protein